MSRTACCFLALGISVAAFAAACGDDSGDGGIGGSGGNGASGGSGGSTAGSAGSGNAGSAGAAGGGAGGSSGGTAGTGSAGTGGSGGSSGTAGTGNAGAAGDGSVPDAGGPDSGVVEPDSGVADAGAPDSGASGSCPDFATATAQTAAQNSQPVAIVRVTFNGNGTGTVVLRGTDSADVGGFTTGDIQQMCTGPADGDCVDPGTFGTVPAQLALNAEVTLTNVPGLDATEGELVLATGLPSDVAASTFAYVAWGTTFTSAAPSGAGLLSWEDRAVLDGFWTVNDRIDVGATQNTFICGGNTGDASNGNTKVAAGFGVCTAN